MSHVQIACSRTEKINKDCKKCIMVPLSAQHCIFLPESIYFKFQNPDDR